MSSNEPIEVVATSVPPAQEETAAGTTATTEPTAEQTTSEPSKQPTTTEGTSAQEGEAKPAEGANPRDEIKDSNVARDAFAAGDVEASKREHAKRTVEEHNGGASEYVKAIVFGGLDGINTTFAVVAANAGSNNDWKTVLVFGFANSFADAFSMGFGETISGMAEMDLARSERARELWEIDNNIQGEIDEMVDLYMEKGYTKEEATTIVEIHSRDRERFVNVMMVDELGMLVDLEDDWVPLKQGLVMFTSFVIFAMFPMIPYFSGKGVGPDYIFGIACGLTGIGMLILGCIRGVLTSMSVPITAIKMLLQGLFSGGISFAIGLLVEYAINGRITFG